MYEPIDSDPEGTAPTDDSAKTKPRRWIWAVAIGLIATLVMAYLTWFTPTETIIDNSDSEELLAYETSMSEPVEALKRARLYDFQTTYADSQYIPAVKAQLAVLDAAEAHSWSDLSEVFFDNGKSRADKLEAIDIFEAEWGPALIGGRETDLAHYKSILDDSEESDWDWSTKKPRQSPSNIDGSELAGAPALSRPNRVIRPAIAPVTVNKNVRIIEARIRRNAKPNYPLRAKRKGYEAEIVLRLNIDERGRVAMTELVSAKAERYRKEFVKASERAALRSRYFPKTVDGKPVSVSGITKKYVYRLAD